MQINKRLIKKEEKYKLLWENPNPKAKMSEDTVINLSSADYDILKTIYCWSVDQNYTQGATEILKGSNALLNMIGASTGNTARRTLIYENDAKYITTGGFYTQNPDNYCIPLKIIGYKLD